MGYTIHSSMFDCVVASAGRFLLCLLIYGMLDISHWWAITVTTTCTVVFLIAKVFQHQWHSQPITYDVMLVGEWFPLGTLSISATGLLWMESTCLRGAASAILLAASSNGSLTRTLRVGYLSPS